MSSKEELLKQVSTSYLNTIDKEAEELKLYQTKEIPGNFYKQIRMNISEFY